jgi:hypothetical protein
MSGKQIYVGEEYHRKLKMISAAQDRDMKDIVEEQIQQMEIPSFEQSESDKDTSSN